MDISITCACCETEILDLSGTDPRLWKGHANASLPFRLTCGGCGCVFGIEDDGIPAESGGSVRQVTLEHHAPEGGAE